MKKSLITSILPFLVLGMVSSSCSVSLFRTKETKEKEKEEKSQVQSHQRELDAQKRKVKALKARLRKERKKVKALTVVLQAVHPPLEGEAFPVDELVAVPEKYLGKELIVEGKLGAPAYFRGPGGHFVLKSLGSMASIQCYFKKEDLDPNSRRILAAKSPRQEMRILGRLLEASGGLSSQIGIRSKSGYEFHVTKIES